MANPQFLNNCYCGKEVEGFIKKVYGDTNFISAFEPRILPSFKCEYVLRTAQIDGCLEAYTCESETPSNQITFDQRTGTMCPIQYGLSINKDALLCTVFEKEYTAGIWNDDIRDTTIWAEVLQLVREYVANQYDLMLLQGDTEYSVSGCTFPCDGLIKKLVEDDNVPKVGISEEVLTCQYPQNNIVNNVFVPMLSAIGVLQFNAQYKNRLKFGVSTDVFEAFVKSLYNNQFQTNEQESLGVPTWRGYPVIPLINMPAGTAILTYSDNLGVFFDAQDDLNQLRIIDKSEFQKSCLLEVWLATRFAVDYMNPEHIVLASTDYTPIEGCNECPCDSGN